MDIYQEYRSQYDTIKKEVKYTNIIKEKMSTAESHILQIEGYVTLLNVDINIL